ncbi:hypothetical protein PVK06_035270 [Gossypium arboreum]|uniref:Uncharacterized protein n=1 Tax=Gossypium arboreum TaxID=29729 RepID=A0ABR0NHJ4_GOSAR|nr:hypothetical protein PVK06_035270 [Gossypium arboreum]
MTLRLIAVRTLARVSQLLKVGSTSEKKLDANHIAFSNIRAQAIIARSSSYADGAGLPPEKKPKLCDDAYEKELENVCVKDTVDKLRSDARQESKTKLNMEDFMVPCREKKKKERSKNSSSVSEVMNIDEDAYLQHLELLLENIPTMFQSSTTAESCFGATIKVHWHLVLMRV